MTGRHLPFIDRLGTALMPFAAHLEGAAAESDILVTIRAQ